MRFAAHAILLVCLLWLDPVQIAQAYVVRTVEAESCQVVRMDGAPATVYDSILASGTKKVGNFWGDKKGDQVTWAVDLYTTETGMKLAVRYSFNAAHYEEVRGKQEISRKLLILVDGTPVGEVDVGDTGNWEDFETTYITLPKLERGRRLLTIMSPEDHMTTDLDAFTLFKGNPESVLTPAFRSSVVTRSSDGRFTVRMTAKAVVRHTPEEILANFNRIYDFFKYYMGWEPDRGVINIHVFEDRLGKGHAYENEHGIYFDASNFNWDRGNWIHEMNHVFDNGLFPPWTGHPLIRVNDSFITGPGCFPELWKGHDAESKRRLALGQKVLSDASYRTDDPHEVFYALYAKYGEKLFWRFYRECREAKKRGEIKLTRNKPLTTPEYVQLLSRAAGEDVRPILFRWSGFRSEMER